MVQSTTKPGEYAVRNSGADSFLSEPVRSPEVVPSASPRCRFCGSPLNHTFADLGVSPLSNSYLSRERLNQAESFFPLHAYVCAECFLVQLEAFETPDKIFTDYAYFSSFSETWLAHCREYVQKMLKRFSPGPESLVVEVASNDGYLLKYFKDAGVPVLGIDPAQNVAREAERKGIPTLAKFFGVHTAQELKSAGRTADIVIGNNVFAHVPDLNDFTAGLKTILKPNGVITLEFPHLLRLMEEAQFDTIYHEHFSYFSFSTAEEVLRHHGLTVFDVDEIPTHGGSLRLFARHSGAVQIEASVRELKQREGAAGIRDIHSYLNFGEKVRAVKRDLLEFLIGAKRAGKSVIGYGAPAKGNTLLNYCGIRTDFLDYTVDLSPHKQNLFLPGTHIPIYSPDLIKQTHPDYVLILPWNLKTEIMEQHSYIREWGGRFVISIPTLQVIA